MEEKSTQQTEVQPVEQVIQTKKSNTGKVIVIVLSILLMLCLVCSAVTFVVYSRFATVVNEEIRKTELETKDQMQKSLDEALKASPTPTEKVESNEVDPAPFATDELPENFPKEFPIYTGSKPTLAQKTDGKAEMVVNFEVRIGMQKIVDYYKSELPKKGWKIDQELNIFGYSMSFSNSSRKGTLIVLGDDSSTSFIVSFETAK